MPNWCYNEIMVKGHPNDIKRISNIIENLNKEDNILFQSLIGLPEGTDIEKYNCEFSDNYDEVNTKWFGTKWDVGFDFAKEIREDTIVFLGETAWSPPINFCIELSKLYNVHVEMYFEEPGLNFCGKYWIDSKVECSEEVYGYHEGMYRFEGFEYWYIREWELISDSLVCKINKEDIPNFQRIIRDEMPFLNDEEVEELSIELKNLVEGVIT